MAKPKAADVGGYRGLFGPRTGTSLWVSGFVTGAAFLRAKRRLEQVYQQVYGRAPSRVTKTDVVEFVLMGEPQARVKLHALKEQAEEGGATTA